MSFLGSYELAAVAIIGKVIDAPREKKGGVPAAHHPANPSHNPLFRRSTELHFDLDTFNVRLSELQHSDCQRQIP